MRSAIKHQRHARGPTEGARRSGASEALRNEPRPEGPAAGKISATAVGTRSNRTAPPSRRAVLCQISRGRLFDFWVSEVKSRSGVLLFSCGTATCDELTEPMSPVLAHGRHCDLQQVFCRAGAESLLSVPRTSAYKKSRARMLLPVSSLDYSCTLYY